MEPPAGDVPKTIYINQAKIKYANVTAFKRTRERTRTKRPGDSENCVHKSGKNLACEKQIEKSAGKPENKK